MGEPVLAVAGFVLAWPLYFCAARILGKSFPLGRLIAVAVLFALGGQIQWLSMQPLSRAFWAWLR